MKKSKYIWSNGKLIPWEQATVHVLSHALHYGSSVFEGIRVYDTPSGSRVFRLGDHLMRIDVVPVIVERPARPFVDPQDASSRPVLVDHRHGRDRRVAPLGAPLQQELQRKCGEINTGQPVHASPPCATSRDRASCL